MGKKIIKVILLGIKNDASIKAVKWDDSYVPLDNMWPGFKNYDVIIKFDSGLYPCIDDLSQHMCDKATMEEKAGTCPVYNAS